jgi:hypothetical protein
MSGVSRLRSGRKQAATTTPSTLHEVQATLGHTNIKMTSTYLNATTHGVKGAFKKLEAERRRKNLKVVRGPQVARR